MTIMKIIPVFKTKIRFDFILDLFTFELTNQEIR